MVREYYLFNEEFLDYCTDLAHFGWDRIRAIKFYDAYARFLYYLYEFYMLRIKNDERFENKKNEDIRYLEIDRIFQK